MTYAALFHLALIACGMAWIVGALR